MEEQVTRLVNKVTKELTASPENYDIRRYMISISGIPGSGKTSLAKHVVDRLNALQAAANPEASPSAVCLSMDGFHMTRAELSAMPNAAEAHERRGAPWTFNAQKLIGILQVIRNKNESVYAPSFDHAVKDPVEDDIVIAPYNRIVVVEGLYLSLDQDVWREASKLFDQTWFVEVDSELAVKRLTQRHLKSGIVDTHEEADKRARGSDYLNADLILAHRSPVDEVIMSVQDDEWYAFYNPDIED